MRKTEILAGLKLRSTISLAGLCFLLFFWRLGSLPFYTRGEPREGLVVQEIYATHDWILPAVNGNYIPFKPPLFHWIAVLTAKGSGKVNEFAVRFPSALFGTLGVFLTYLVGTRLWEERVGMISALVLATSHEWWESGVLAQVDMTLAFFMAAAFFLFLFVYRERERDGGGLRPLGIALFLALATLAKGPVGVLVPSLVFLLFLWIRHDFAFLKKLHLFAGTAVFILTAGSWYALALWRGGEEFFLRQIVEENLQTASGTYGHYQTVFYYLPRFFLNMAPWSFFLPCIAVFLYRQPEWLSEDRVSYLLVWVATVLAFFSISLGKRAVYILSLYPAVALLFGAWWMKLEKGQADFLRLARAVGYLIAVFYLVVPSVLLVRFLGWDILDRIRSADHRHAHSQLFLVLRSLDSPSWLVWACLALSGIVALLLVWALSKKRWNAVFVCLSIGTMATVLAIKDVYYPPMAAEQTFKPFMMRVRKVVANETPLFFYHSFDYGAIFYAGRHIHEYSEEKGFPKPPFYLLMWEEQWKQILGEQGLEKLDISEGLGPAGRHHLVLVEVKKAIPNLQGKPELPDQED